MKKKKLTKNMSQDYNDCFIVKQATSIIFLSCLWRGMKDYYTSPYQRKQEHFVLTYSPYNCIN